MTSTEQQTHRLAKKLNRELKQLACKLMDGVTKAELRSIVERRDQIIKELEQCIGVCVIPKTFEDVLEENRLILEGKIDR